MTDVLRNKLINPRINIITVFQDVCQDKNAILDQCLKALPFIKSLTLNFNLLLKNILECSFVSSECSLQSSSVCFAVRSEYSR